MKTGSRVVSVAVPIRIQAVRRLAIEAWRRAEAMGIVNAGATRVDQLDVAELVRRIGQAGIARGPALRFDNVDVPSAEEAESMLRLVINALEASPAPVYEWPSVARVLDPDGLA